MFFGLITFMPNSPGQLLQKARVEESRHEFTKAQRDLYWHQVHEGFAFMRAQNEYGTEQEITSYTELFEVFRRHVLVYVMFKIFNSRDA